MASAKRFSDCVAVTGVASTSRCAVHLPRRALSTWTTRKSLASSLQVPQLSRDIDQGALASVRGTTRQQQKQVWFPLSQQVRHSHVGKQRIRVPANASIEILEFPPHPNPLKVLPQSLKGQGSILVKGPAGQVLLPLLPKVYLYTQAQKHALEHAQKEAAGSSDAAQEENTSHSYRLTLNQGVAALQSSGATQGDVKASRTLLVGVETNDTKAVRAAWGTTAAKLVNAIQGVTQGHKYHLDLVGVGYRAALEEDPFPRPDDVERALQAADEGPSSKLTAHFTGAEQQQFYASRVQDWKEATPTGTEQDAHVQKDAQGQRAKLRLHLRLGYSHPVLIPVPRGITVAVPSPTVIDLWGADKEDLGLFAATIRMWRRPEPYKGKGIYVNGEKIQLRTAKKK